MPWQRYVADVAMEVNDAGELVYDRVVVTVPRQSGKTTLVLAVLTHRSVAEFPGGRLDTGPQRQTVAYTAQTRNDARKKWIKEFIPVLEGSPFRQKFSKRLTNGSEGFDWVNGSTFDLVATMEKSGHGDTLDLGIIDEAFAQTDDRLEQGLEPAMVTRRSPQLWIISTAGENPYKSPFLWTQVQSGREACDQGVGSSTAYFEWSVGVDEDLDDLEVVAARHPAVGHTITLDVLRKRRDRAEREGDLAGYKRAYCNMWGSGVEDRDPKLPPDAWKASEVTTQVEAVPGQVSLAFDVSLDGRWTSVAIGVGDLTAPYVELIEHREGAGWLPDRLVELVQRWEPLAVGVNGAGPSGALVASVLEAFRAAEVDVGLLRQLTGTEYKQACGGFFVDVVEGRLAHYAGQGPLDAAAGDATDRPLGDAWAWDLRSATVPISPLVAATIARALLPTEAKVTVDVAANVW